MDSWPPQEDPSWRWRSICWALQRHCQLSRRHPKKTMSVLAADHHFDGSKRWEESHAHHLGEKDALNNRLFIPALFLYSSHLETYAPYRNKPQNSDETSFPNINQTGCQKTISAKIRDPNRFFVARLVETVSLPLKQQALKSK